MFNFSFQKIKKTKNPTDAKEFAENQQILDAEMNTCFAKDVWTNILKIISHGNHARNADNLDYQNKP